MPAARSVRLVYVLVASLALLIIGRNLYYRHLNNSLIAAVEARNVAAVRALLRRGADPNTNKPPAGNAKEGPLLLLGLLDDTRSLDNDYIACLLIEGGADIREDPKSSSSYLETACWNGKLSVVRCLLHKGANASFTDSNHTTAVDSVLRFVFNGNAVSNIALASDGTLLIETPQQIAARRAREFSKRFTLGKEIIRLLQQHGARLSLWQAIQIHDNAILRTVLNSGIDLEAKERNYHGSTLLEVAAQSGNEEAVQLLVQHGANVNAVDPNYGSPLIAAIYQHHAEVAHYLLEHGANVNASLHQSNSPLMAAINTSPDLVSYLLQHGADLKREGIPALREAMRSQQPQLVSLLLQKGIKYQGPAGHILLSTALEYRPDLVPLFLAQGTSGHETQQERDSLLWSAIHFERQELIMPLIRAGASTNATHYDSTPLMEAIGHDPRFVKLLLDKGAGPTKVVGLSQTPLGMAAQSGKVEATKLLLLHGARVNQTGRLGRTALYYARKHHHTEIATLLEKAGGREK